VACRRVAPSPDESGVRPAHRVKSS
jgi:hypothetical protein